jgi:hypothetical protein
MKRRTRPRPVDSAMRNPSDGERCLNAEFLLHLERAVREVRRERTRSAGRSSATARSPRSVPYGTEPR